MGVDAINTLRVSMNDSGFVKYQHEVLVCLCM